MALQNLCIDIIVNNFERYFLQFPNTKDAELKRGFEFLQRKFSYEIVSSLYEEGRMKTEYIDFLINKHLKVLEFDWLKGCSWERIVDKFKEVGPGLQELDFGSDHHELPLQKLMCHLNNLQVMSYQFYCNDEILESLAKCCHNVIEIDIRSSKAVTAEGIKSLCAKDDKAGSGLRLRRLTILHCMGIHAGVIYLIKHMPSIELLDYRYLPEALYSIHKNNLSQIDKLKPCNIRKLDLIPVSARAHYTDILRMSVSLCPRMKYLSCWILKQEHLKFLNGFSELQTLRLENYSPSEVEIDELLELNRRLYRLHVSKVSLSVFTLANCCPSLKQLTLSGVSLKTDNVVSPLFPCLETCIFDSMVWNTEFEKAVRLLLRYSPKLNSFAFKKCDLSSCDLKTEILKCCEHRSIRKINFTGSAVDKAFSQNILLNCPSLKSFTLENCGLDSNEELELEELARLLPNNPEIFFWDI